MTGRHDFSAHTLPGFNWPFGNRGPLVYGLRPGNNSQDHLVTPDSAEEFVEILRGTPRDFVSFQHCDTLALNPDYGSDGNQITMRAVYGFPRDYAAHMIWWWREEKHAYMATGIEFVHRPHAFLFDIAESRKILDTGSYSMDALMADLEKLHQAGSNTHGWMGWMKSAARMDIEDIRNHSKLFFLAIETIVNQRLPVSDPDNTGYMHHPDKPEAWRQLLLGLGYAAVLDRHALLTGDLGQQIAVLDDAALCNVVQISNPIRCWNNPHEPAHSL